MSNPTSKASSVAPAARPPHVKLYNTNKYRRGNPTVFPQHMLKDSSTNPVRLVPIRLDLEVDGFKIRDSFTWNLNETLITPEQFAQLLIDDIYEGPQSSSTALISQIANSMRSQCQAWQNAVHDDEDAYVSTNIPGSDEDDPGWRTVIRLDLQVGQVHLVDQFEWPLLPSTADHGDDESVGADLPTPESFSRQLCADLALGSEFVSIIAHSIREQLCYARLNFDEAPKMQGLQDVPVRKELDDGWNPVVENLSEEEIERRFKEQERTARRLRRSQRISTTNTIVINRGYGEDGDSDEEGGRRRSSRNASMGGRMPGGPMRNNSGFGGNRMMGYAAFSALPLQYQSGMYNPSALAFGMRQQAMQNKAIPYRNYKPSPEEEAVILKKLEESINLKELKPQTSPPKRHRGFGASANRFNDTGAIPVGEFREKWRCSWCLLSGKFTPTLRKGPMGSKTLCNACGIWYGKHGSLPKERYHEHGDDTN